MFPVDISLIASILTSVVLVSILILVKIRQEKTAQRLGKTSNSPTAKIESKPPNEEAQTKQNKCPQYFGYLHNSAREHPLFKINPEGSSFPEECYGCHKLMECLYSPTTIQRIYGDDDDET